MIGTEVIHARYVPHGHAHYGGNLVDGAYALGLFGDAATELCIRTDGDEGLFASYSSVEFAAAIYGGDCIQVRARLTEAGNRSRTMDFVLVVTARADHATTGSAARLVEPPLLAVCARGVVVVPAPKVST